MKSGMSHPSHFAFCTAVLSFFSFARQQRAKGGLNMKGNEILFEEKPTIFDYIMMHPAVETFIKP